MTDDLSGGSPTARRSGAVRRRRRAIIGAVALWPFLAAAQPATDKDGAGGGEPACATAPHVSTVELDGQAVCFDTRIRLFAAYELEVATSDARLLIVKAFGLYRVEDPQTYVAAVSTAEAGDRRLAELLTHALRSELGAAASDDILSARGSEAMIRVRDKIAEEARPIGVEVIDVRLVSVLPPPATLGAIFDRMAAERRDLVERILAEGEAQARRRRAEAEREAFLITSEARVAAVERVAAAMAERAQITAAAYGEDPEFFELFRSLRRAEPDLAGDDASEALTPDGDPIGPLWETEPPASGEPALEE